MRTLKGKPPVGELRPSQLLHTFGIGSIIDLPNLSVMVMGLDDWDVKRCVTVSEPRLLAAVRTSVGPQVERLVAPPPNDDAGPGRAGQSPSEVTGVPVAPFPRYMRCPSCDFLAPLASEVFHIKYDPYRPDRTRYVHEHCTRAKAPTVVAARFLVACEHGHLDDFPWKYFVHKGDSTCSPRLTLRELGVSGEAAEIEVECQTCGLKRRMVEAFGKEAAKNLPRCRGRMPHLRSWAEDCGAEVETLLLGASDSWFAMMETALSVPVSADTLAELVRAHWTKLQDVVDPVILTFLRKQGQLLAFDAFSDAALWAAIEKRRAGTPDEAAGGDLKRPEWEVFCAADPARNTADFKLRAVEPPRAYAGALGQVVLADRLREVSAMVGFTRLESPRTFACPGEAMEKRRAPLSRSAPKVVPAAEVRGEGIFLRFDEARLAAWCEGVEERAREFHAAHTQWRAARGIEAPELGFPGARYLLLHSFSHALMRQVALECGYAAASIRERIYAREPEADGGPMAGVLLYTAAPDSEGTLGGLVRLGEPRELGRHIALALDAMRLCASDPLCAEHHPIRDGVSLHGAACHACLFAPETSCERGNLYLDRTLLVETVSDGGLAFFGGER